MDEPAEERTPLTSHLEELRRRLVRIVIVVIIGFVVCYHYREILLRIITAPLVDALPANSFMVFTSLPEAFFAYMKIAFFSSLVLTSPYTFYQLWKFISPGLYQKEKKYVIPFVVTSTMLFTAGVVFGYYIALPPAYMFFIEFSSDFLKPMLSLNAYLSLTLKFLFAFGICFELPVVIFFMTKIGVVNAALLSKHRRYAILGIFIVAAILTPTPDAFSQVIMAIPLMILYEISIYVAKIAERKRKKASEENDESAK